MTRKRTEKTPLEPERKPAKLFSKPWFVSHTKRERLWFDNNACMLFCLLLVFGTTLFADEADSYYFKAHGSLLIGSVAVVLLLFIRRHDAGHLFENARRALTLDDSARLDDFADVLFVAAMSIVAISILFVIDLSFFSNYGLRIGAVAAIGLFTLFKTATDSLKW